MVGTVRSQDTESVPPRRPAGFLRAPGRPTRMPGRRVLSLIAAVALGAAALTGCAAGQISQTVDVVPNHDGGQGTIGQVGVHNALIGTSDDASGAVAFKKGSSAPLNFWVTNNALAADTLTSVTSPDGTVTLSGTATVPAQSYLQVGPPSKVTATIDDLSQDVRYGFPVTVDFYFQNAGKLSLQIPIEIPPNRGSDRQSTDIYPAEETNVWGQPISDNG